MREDESANDRTTARPATGALRVDVEALHRAISKGEAALRVDALPGVRAEELRAALPRLRRRLLNAAKVDQSHWNRPAKPTRALNGSPVLYATSVDLAIVALLSATEITWQFSRSEQGRMFTHVAPGPGSEQPERLYVDGSSSVIDAASALIVSHRGNAGGRVLVDRRAIYCAHCDAPLVWVNTPRTGPLAQDSCPSRTERGTFALPGAPSSAEVRRADARARDAARWHSRAKEIQRAADREANKAVRRALLAEARAAEVAAGRPDDKDARRAAAQATSTTARVRLAVARAAGRDRVVRAEAVTPGADSLAVRRDGLVLPPRGTEPGEGDRALPRPVARRY